MRKLVAEAGLEDQVAIESAGTGGWHVGNPADQRAAASARKRGYELVGTARQVEPEDFERFDLLVAMDRSNHTDLLALAPDGYEAKVRLLREFGDGEPLDVPDPYYGGDDGFEDVLDIVERCCAALLREVEAGELAVG